MSETRRISRRYEPDLTGLVITEEEIGTFVVLGFDSDRDAWFARRADASPNAPYVWVEDPLSWDHRWPSPRINPGRPSGPVGVA